MAFASDQFSAFCNGLSIPVKKQDPRRVNYQEKKSGDVIVLILGGKLMGGPETTEISDRMQALLKKGFLKIVVDMHQVKWMNSSGLGMLMSCLKTLRSQQGDLRLAEVSEKVESLLMITHLLKIFKSFPTRDEAVQSFSE